MINTILHYSKINMILDVIVVASRVDFRIKYAAMKMPVKQAKNVKI